MNEMREWVEYIARNKDNSLWGFANEPTKGESGWSDGGNYMLIKEVDDAYNYVKWTDNIAARVDQSLKEPTSVKTISDENYPTEFSRLNNELAKEVETWPKDVEEYQEHWDSNPIEPNHYKTGNKDLFDRWHEEYYYSEKMYTGREVFIAIMKAVAERYSYRFPEKNPEDLGKSIYTLERLKEYEERGDECE